MTVEQADKLAAVSCNPPKPHSVRPAPGTLIRMTRSDLPFFRIGDMAVVQDTYWANFNGLGNPSVYDDGIWCVSNGYWLIVKEAPH